MGGPGSGRRTAVRGPDGKFLPAGTEAAAPWPVGISRVELEPVMARDLAIGDEAAAEAIRAELAARTWQWTNPYAGTED